MSIIRSVSDISIIGIIRVMGSRVFITPIILILPIILNLRCYTITPLHHYRGVITVIFVICNKKIGATENP